MKLSITLDLGTRIPSHRPSIVRQTVLENLEWMLKNDDKILQAILDADINDVDTTTDLAVGAGALTMPVHFEVTR